MVRIIEKNINISHSSQTVAGEETIDMSCDDGEYAEPQPSAEELALRKELAELEKKVEEKKLRVLQRRKEKLQRELEKEEEEEEEVEIMHNKRKSGEKKAKGQG